MAKELKVEPQRIGKETLYPVVLWFDGRQRPDLITEGQLSRFRLLGYTIEDHPTGFKLIYKEQVQCFDEFLDDFLLEKRN